MNPTTHAPPGRRDVAEASARHYEDFLAPVYSWMMGGAHSALERGRRELVESGILDDCPTFAVDLGAGFGMHAIPLARAGARVIALDSSAQLLRELVTLSEGYEIRAIRDDLLRFGDHLPTQPDLVLCMGDTLPHLPDRTSVTTLIERVAERLAIGGRFLVSFRDYTAEREGADRFVSVRHDERRLMTCFLEFDADSLRVHDILHELHDGTWHMRVSAYSKLRLSPAWVQAQFERCGLTGAAVAGQAGVIRLLGTRTQ